MDEHAEAGSYKDLSRCKLTCKRVSAVIVGVLLFPLLLILIWPYLFGTELWKATKKCPIVLRVIMVVFSTIIGLALGVFLYPLMLIGCIFAVAFSIVAAILYLLSCCLCFQPCRRRKARLQ